MSRNAFAIEKLCVFFETPQQAAAALPASARPGRGDRTGVAEKRGGDRRRCGQGRGAARTGRPAGRPARMHLAVGDSENDRAMLQKAGVAAVMANGMPEIRALAHLVSKADCDHDGVAEILETLGI